MVSRLPRLRSRMLARWLASVALALSVLAGAAVGADALWPPDPSRYARPVGGGNGQGPPHPAGFHHAGRIVAAGGRRDVNPRYLKLLKAYEDKRFDDHWGVDPVAMVRAALQFARGPHRLRRLDADHAGRASAGAAPARARHQALPDGARAAAGRALFKDEILSIYLTLAPFGGNLEGVRAASLAYFGKEPAALDLVRSRIARRAAAIAGAARPDRHAIAASAGRDKVLARMVAEGVVTAGERRGGAPRPCLLAPADAASPRRIWRSGCVRDAPSGRCSSPRSTPTCRAPSRTLARASEKYLEDGGSLAVVVVENRPATCSPMSAARIIGGASGQIDLAQRPRSPGSALKPFIYGLAFDDRACIPRA